MILIHGRGVTALSCANLLLQKGFNVKINGKPFSSELSVLIDLSTLQLLAQIFEDKNIVELGYPIQHRIVKWGDDAPKVVNAHAKAIKLNQLNSSLERSLSDILFCKENNDDESIECHIDATGRRSQIAYKLAGATNTFFGSREMITTQVEASLDHCITETVENGWLFMFPVSTNRAIVQMMCPVTNAEANHKSILENAIQQSSLINFYTHSRNIERIACFPASPKILSSLGSNRWLAVGHAAFTVDPICGNGIGAAIHSAILAAATLEKKDSTEFNTAIDHYHKRQQLSFVLHLQHINDYYKCFAHNRNWQQELSSTRQFLESNTATNILNYDNMYYQLANNSLVKLEDLVS